MRSGCCVGFFGGRVVRRNGFRPEGVRERILARAKEQREWLIRQTASQPASRTAQLVILFLCDT